MLGTKCFHPFLQSPIYTPIDTFINDVICIKALKSVSFFRKKFSQIASVEPTLTVYWHKRGEQLSLVQFIKFVMHSQN